MQDMVHHNLAECDTCFDPRSRGLQAASKEGPKSGLKNCRLLGPTFKAQKTGRKVGTKRKTQTLRVPSLVPGIWSKIWAPKWGRILA